MRRLEHGTISTTRMIPPQIQHYMLVIIEPVWRLGIFMVICVFSSTHVPHHELNTMNKKHHYAFKSHVWPQVILVVVMLLSIISESSKCFEEAELRYCGISKVGDKDNTHCLSPKLSKIPLFSLNSELSRIFLRSMQCAPFIALFLLY